MIRVRVGDRVGGKKEVWEGVAGWVGQGSQVCAMAPATAPAAGRGGGGKPGPWPWYLPTSLMSFTLRFFSTLRALSSAGSASSSTAWGKGEAGEGVVQSSVGGGGTNGGEGRKGEMCCFIPRRPSR